MNSSFSYKGILLQCAQVGALGLVLLCVSSITFGQYDSRDTAFVMNSYRQGMEIKEDYPDSALNLANSAMSKAQGIDFVKGLERLCFLKGFAYEFKGELDSSLLYYDKALRFATELRDSIAMGEMLMSKGIACYYQKEYARAIGFYDECLDHYTKTKNLVGQGKVLNNFAVIYRIRRNYTKAIEIYRRAIKIKELLKDTMGLANSYNNLGLALFHCDSDQVSLSHFKSALRYYDAMGDEYQAAAAKANLAQAYFNLNRSDTAKVLLSEAFPVLEKKLTIDLMLAAMNLSVIDRVEGRPAMALNRLLKYYDAVVSTNVLDSRQAYEFELASSYFMLGNSDEAYKHLMNYVELSKELDKEARERLTEEMQVRFETKEQENKIVLQRQVIDEQNRQRRYLYIAIELTALLLLLAVWFGISKFKSNRRLNEANSKLELALKDREVLLKEIHHRVKNNLQVVSSLLSIQSRTIQDEKAQAVINEGRSRVDSMALIHRFLYEKGDLRAIDMNLYLSELCDTIFESYSMYNDRVVLEKSIQKIDLDVDTAVPLGLIINELVANALKHGFPDEKEGKVAVEFSEVNDALLICVKDNGVGSEGIEIKSTSFGMKLLKAFAPKLGATINIIKSPGFTLEYRVTKYKTL